MDDLYAPRSEMDTAALINRAIADMVEAERRLGKGGRITKIIEELLRLPERNPAKG